MFLFFLYALNWIGGDTTPFGATKDPIFKVDERI